MKHVKRGNVIGMCLVALLVNISISHYCLAVTTEEELKNWPQACYQGEELNKLREWEKTWVGKKVNQDNIDQVKEFMTEQFYNMFKNPKDWGTDELWFTIVPYQQLPTTPGQVAFTKKYAPTAKLDPNPVECFWKEGIGPNEFLMGWEKGEQAGFPFPFPKSGLEMAWNLESNTRGDTKSMNRLGVVVNPRTRVERRAVQPWLYDYFTGRCDAPPTPNKPKNPKGIRRAMYLFIEEPLDVQGTRYMELRYLDVKRSDDVWVWFPLFRRIRRMGFSYKADTIDGSDLAPDDEVGWNGHVNLKTWKIIGRKELLVSRHQDLDKLTRGNGQAVWSGYMMERMNSYVLEAKWKDQNAVYSKELLYMDPEDWKCLQKVTWDRQGRIWRQFFYNTMVVKGTTGGTEGFEQPHVYELYSSDLQRRHGGPSLDKIDELGQTIHNRFWSIQNLQKLGY
ncbi:MAG: DUF1329 domain-containing protein [Deltaproteobacteria bacterium]|nr:DUF1329 domain-containing protein [Deltaproteobacteria bacterium]